MNSQSPPPTPPPDITYRLWPHTPAHIFQSGTTYMVTAGTHQKQHFFNTPAKLSLLRNALFDHAEQHNWGLEAWSIFSNHYHIITQSENGREDLDRMLQALHSTAAIALNKLDNQAGRQVWWNYWDTRLSFHKSYMARLHYVHRNAEKHGIVAKAEDYPWCSMSWFVQEAPPGFRRSVLGFKIDTLKVFDDF